MWYIYISMYNIIILNVAVLFKVNMMIEDNIQKEINGI